MRKRLGLYSKLRRRFGVRRLAVGALVLFLVLGASLFSVRNTLASLLGGAFGNNNSATSVQLDKGLVGHWKLDGNAKDATPYGRNGVASNLTSVADRKTKAASSYSFNGTTSRIDVSSAPAPTTSGSVSAWVYVNAWGSNYDSVVFKGPGVSWADIDYAIVRNGAATGFIGTINNGTNNMSGTGPTSATISTGQWYHLLFSWDGTNAKFYTNGALTGTVAWTAAAGNRSSNMKMGMAVNGTSYPLNGSLDDVRVYNRAINADEVKALYDNYGGGIQVSDLQKGLVGQYKMDGNAKDASPRQNDGTVNAATLTADRKGAANSAYSFNGTTSYIRSGGHTGLGTVNQPYSVTGWFKATSTTGNLVHVSSGSIGNGWCLPVVALSAGNLRAQSWNGGSVIATSPTAIVAGNWYHFATTWDSVNGLRIYLDGSMSASAAQSTFSASGASNYVHLGFSYGGCSGDTGWFNGSLDDVRIYNRSLSATEVSSLYNSYNSNVQGSSLMKGIIGNWQLDGNTKDATPFAKNLSVSGAPTLATDRKGRANSAYNFGGQGTGQNLYFSSSGMPTAAITVSAWIYQTSWANWYTLINNGWCTYDGSTLMFTDVSGTTYFGVSRNGCSEQYNAYCPTGSLALSTWKHVVGTYDGTTVKVYVDGAVCPNTSTVSQALTSSGSTFIGDGYTTGSTNHKIDDVRIWNRALTATEVADLYAQYR